MRQVGKVLAFYSFRDWPSNHYLCWFAVHDVEFNCMEQFLMYTKAMHFGDREIAAKILAEPVPQKQKLLGRQVKGYVDDSWKANRERYCEYGLKAKYCQNLNLLVKLLVTRGLSLVEASSKDFAWGCGFDEDHPDIDKPNLYPGENILGRAHDTVRAYLEPLNLV